MEFLVNRETPEQLKTLIDEVNRNPSLGNETVFYDENWRPLADKLNALPGPNKTVLEWKAVLREWQELVDQVRQNVNNDADVPSTATEKKEGKKRSLLEELLFKPREKYIPGTSRSVTKLFRRMEKVQKINSKRTTLASVQRKTTKGHNKMFNLRAPMRPQADGDNEDAANETIKSLTQGMKVNVTKEGTQLIGPDKRIIVCLREGSNTSEGKAFKIYFDGEDTDEISLHGGPEAEFQLKVLRGVTEVVEKQIDCMQERIHIVKDLWKHRCGDN